MTPLSPVETDRVRGVPSQRYPLNRVCSFPGCKRTDVTAHHIFGRPKGPYSGSWFVEVDKFSPYEFTEAASKIAIPAVTGACGHGTEGHHGDYEAHRLWIKYEDGIFNVYQRSEYYDGPEGAEGGDGTWVLIGPLDPQPPNTEKKRGRAPNKKGEEKRKRKNITIGVPADTEDGAGIWDDTLEEVKQRLISMGLYSENDNIPNYEAIIAAWRDWLNG